MLNAETCWNAVCERDASFDGQFFFGVLTTGVYCRPSCAARRPLRQNVRFYAQAMEAEADGLRACLRCHPGTNESAGEAAVRVVCSHIEAYCADPLPLAELSRVAGLSAFHLQRLFKAATGLTPRQYQQACRTRKFKAGLREAGSVTGAIFDAGFGSLSRAYEADALGMTPRQYRGGGEGLDIRYAFAGTPVGLMVVAATDRGLCSVQFGGSETELEGMLRAEFPLATVAPMGSGSFPEFESWLNALREHLSGARRILNLPLDTQATIFQMRVWRYLQTIPYGATRSYAEVAEALGEPRSVRAVARACASNRVALAIPCHRVIRGDGSLAGYRWGVERKRALLDSERSS